MSEDDWMLSLVLICLGPGELDGKDKVVTATRVVTVTILATL